MHNNATDKLRLSVPPDFQVRMQPLMESKNTDEGILLVGHGTRDAGGMAEVKELAGKVATRSAAAG